MLKRNRSRAWLLALLSPTAALALGLGDIHLKSTLNAPLDADIDVLSASPEDMADLKANIASRDQFNRNGLDYPSFLGGVTLTPTKSSDGRYVLHVHSADSVSEPFATLLVEVNWARGHLMHEYTVLLDPPVFSPAPSANATVSAPSTPAEHAAAAQTAPVAQAAASGGTPADATSPTDNTSGAASRAAGSGPRPGASSYNVRTGDTLSSIAASMYPSSDHLARERQLVAIYRDNSAAFAGNMNLLRAGSVLKLPSDSELAAVSPTEAADEVHTQYAAFHAGHAEAATAGGQLRLVPPRETGQPSTPAATAAGSAAAGTSAGTAALQQQVQQLQSQLSESQRLLQLKDAQLQALQQQIARKAPTPAPAPSAPAAVPPLAAQPPAPAQQTAPTPPPVAPEATPAPPVAAEPPATNPPPPPVSPPKAAPESGTSILGLIESYWYVPAGLLAIVLALLGLRFVRSRQEEDFDRSLGRLQPAFDPTATATRTSDTMPVRAHTAREEQSYRVEESGSHEQPVFDEQPDFNRTSATGQHIAIDDSMAGEAPVALDQGDPLAEADFHMAYGLYDQAAELVQIAITREPNRRDLKLKLLEVFFVWGNRDRFLLSARELVASREQALPGEWEKIVIMGRQIAPEDALFSDAGALGGAAAGGVDLNLEGGQNRVDFDLLGEPTVTSTGAEGAVDLDLGAALGSSEPTGETHGLSDSGVDFVLDDPERGNDSTGSTREMPGQEGGTATVQVAGGIDGEAPTVEQPQLRQSGDHPTIREKIDAATRAGMMHADQTAELAIDDLGLDLGAFANSPDETGLQEQLGEGQMPPDNDVGEQTRPHAALPDDANAPTMLAGLDDETRRLLNRAHAAPSADADSTRDQPGGMPGASAGSTNTGTWLFTDTDFDLGTARPAPDAPTELVTQIAPPPDIDVGATSRLATLDLHSVDLDLGDLGDIGAAPAANGVDLNVGPMPHADEAASTQRLSQGDVPLPELEPATMSEVGTKLDLARAYMDMGDPEGARSILNEVLSEGSVSQKQEARRLMDTLPG